MTNKTTSTVPFSLNDQNSETLFQKALHQATRLVPGQVVPKDLILDLERAMDSGSIKALRLLVKLLLHKPNNLSNDERYILLKKAAPKSQEASQELWLAWEDDSKILDSSYISENDTTIINYFIDSVILTHDKKIQENNYQHFLTAICDERLDIDPNHFLLATEMIIRQTKNTMVAYILGCLLCGFQVRPWPELQKLKLYNPNEGFRYLRQVVDTDGEYQERALLSIEDGIIDNIFDQEIATKYQKLIEILSFQTLPQIQNQP